MQNGGGSVVTSEAQKRAGFPSDDRSMKLVVVGNSVSHCRVVSGWFLLLVITNHWLGADLHIEKRLEDLVCIPYVKHKREDTLKKNLRKQWSVSLISDIICEVYCSFRCCVCDLHNIGTSGCERCQILLWSLKHLPFAGPLFACGMLRASAYELELALSSRKWAHTLVAVWSTATEGGVLQPEGFSHC